MYILFIVAACNPANDTSVLLHVGHINSQWKYNLETLKHTEQVVNFCSLFFLLKNLFRLLWLNPANILKWSQDNLLIRMQIWLCAKQSSNATNQALYKIKNDTIPHWTVLSQSSRIRCYETCVWEKGCLFHCKTLFRIIKVLFSFSPYFLVTSTTKLQVKRRENLAEIF